MTGRKLISSDEAVVGKKQHTTPCSDCPYRPEQLGAFVTTQAMARSGLMGQEQVAIQRRKDEIARVAELREEAAEYRSSAESSTNLAAKYEAQAAELEAKLLADTGDAA